MGKKNPVGIFLAATAILSASSINPNLTNAGGRNSGMGGLREWSTDQAVDAESTLDEDARAAVKKAKEEDVCIPIGEGENCW